MINAKIVAIFTKENEEERVYQFLMGLNDEVFGTVRSSIIQEEPTPKVKKVLAWVCKEKQYHTLVRGTPEDKWGGARVAFAAI